MASTEGYLGRLRNTAGLWAVVITVYLLLDIGLTEGVWPMLGHYHHLGHVFPVLVDSIVKNFVLPFISGCIVGGTLRQCFSKRPWPILIGPLIMIVLYGYISDSFYSPWWDEAIARLAPATLQGLSAWGGWRLGRLLSCRYARCDLASNPVD